MSRAALAREAHYVGVLRENTFKALWARLVAKYTGNVRSEFGRELMVAHLRGFVGDGSVGTRIDACKFLLGEE